MTTNFKTWAACTAVLCLAFPLAGTSMLAAQLVIPGGSALIALLVRN